MSDRVKCNQCDRMILEDTARDNNGLCAPCMKEFAPPPSRYEQESKIPVAQLTESQKRDQLQGAIQDADEPRVEALLSCNNDFLSKPPDDYTTWLGHAISHNCGIATLRKMFAAGCDTNARALSPDATSVLEVAVDDNRTDAVQWLLENGADPNIGRPMIGAVSFRKPPEVQIELLKLLLDAGGEINKTYALYGDESDRFTVLDWAHLYEAALEVVHFFEERGANRLEEL